jgi:hypothetical protein
MCDLLLRRSYAASILFAAQTKWTSNESYYEWGWVNDTPRKEIAKNFKYGNPR